MKEIRKKILIAVAVVASYAISYLAASRNGFYAPEIFGLHQGRDGRAYLTPKGSGYYWMPFECFYPVRCRDWKAILLEVLFMPMISADRALWHQNDKVYSQRYRTKDFFDTQTDEWRDIK